jgi:hypothetical protein
MQKCFEIPNLPSRLDAFVGPKIESGTSRWGVEITPAKPSFHENFPEVILVPKPYTYKFTAVGEQPTEWEGLMMYYFSFYIIPGNYNHLPVYDAKLNKVTNGCSDNKCFSIEYKKTATEIANNPPFIDPKDIEKHGGKLIPGHPEFDEVMYALYREDTGNLRSRISCNPHTGKVKGYISLLNLNQQDYEVPVTLIVQNGNGEVRKQISLVLTSTKEAYQSSPPSILTLDDLPS